MFQDEARFGRISDVRRCWAPRPVRPLCQGMLTHEYTYVFGAVDVCTGDLDSLILAHVNTGCMQLFLNEVSLREKFFHNRVFNSLDALENHLAAALKTSKELDSGASGSGSKRP